MHCPYLVETESCIEIWHQTPNESETITDGNTIRIVKHQYAKCVKEECGAYYNGKCNYNIEG